MRAILKRAALICLVVLGGVAIAQNVVDQGAPGTQGSWKVTNVAPSPSPSGVSACNVKVPAATNTTLNATGSACTAIGGAGCTTIYAATDWSPWGNITITIVNTGASNTVTNVLVEWSADGTNYELWDNTTFAALGTTTTKSLALSGNSRRYLRIEAKSTSGTTVSVLITANDC